jgi:uncharacterized membrane protein YkoI
MKTMTLFAALATIGGMAMAYPHLQNAGLETAKPAQGNVPAADPAAKAKVAAARAAKIATLTKTISASKTTLGAAIAAAEKETGGVAAEAEMEMEDDGSLEIEVVILKDGKVLEVEIDPATGKVMEVEEEDDEDDDDEDDDDGADDDDN